MRVTIRSRKHAFRSDKLCGTMYAWRYSAHICNGRLAGACGTRNVHCTPRLNRRTGGEQLTTFTGMCRMLRCCLDAWRPHGTQAAKGPNYFCSYSTCDFRDSTYQDRCTLSQRPADRGTTHTATYRRTAGSATRGNLLRERTSHPPGRMMASALAHTRAAVSQRRAVCAWQQMHATDACRDATASAAGGSRQPLH